MASDASSVSNAVHDLATHYDEPWRHYHSRRHVEEVLTALRSLVGEELHPALELAAWAHDAVYDPRATQGMNERASADLARKVCTAHGIDAAVTDEVVALTLATITHTVPEGPDDPARVLRARAFLDADLWILASPADRFAEYERQIRAEYAVVPDAVFVEARSAVLAEFATRKRLYLSPGARAWDAAARRNLAVVQGASPSSPTEVGADQTRGVE